MATSEELQAILQIHSDTVLEYKAEKNQYASRYAAINPASPTASEELATISKESDISTAKTNSALAANHRALTSFMSDAPPEDKAQYRKTADLVYNDNARIADTALTASAEAFIAATAAIKSAEAAVDPTTTVKSTAATNPDATAAATDAKYSTQTAPVSTSFSDARNEATGVYNAPPVVRLSDAQFETNRVTPSAAMPRKKVWAKVVLKDAIGNVQGVDLRVKIRVPTNYLTNSTSGINKELSKLGGIIFPYTPSISYEHKADYTSQTPTHSNFAVYFYKNSSISAITITGKFTVQNDTDAGVYLATVHLLRALTKMRSGGRTGDADSGAPPPVCRLDAYGDAMLANVPVAITSFRLELADNVDYYNLGPEAAAIYGQASVPTLSTITLSCIPMYSRQEMQDYSVTDWLNNPQVRKYGLL
jgi:hypothetical protein